MKQEVRIVAWDDCAFARHDEKVRLVGAIFRGASFLDGLLSAFVEKDGTDATDVLSDAIRSSRHYDQLSLVMTDGISFGGLNLVDLAELHARTLLPVIAVQRKKPDVRAFEQAMAKLPPHRQRAAALRAAGPIKRWEQLFYQSHGLDDAGCERVFALTCIRSHIPEPLRVAHLIASGLSRAHGDGYESRGRA